MKQEALSYMQIRNDLMLIDKHKKSIQIMWRMNYIIGFGMLSVILSIRPLIFFQWMLPLPVVIYHAVLLYLWMKQHRPIERALRQAEGMDAFSVSLEKLTRIVDETVYEPHLGTRRFHSHSIVREMYFYSGASWRIPPVKKHYRWSDACCMSSQGLENTSVSGDEFYLISLKHESSVAYIYNTKFFRLREEKSGPDSFERE